MELHDKHVRCVEIKPITLYESRLKALLGTFWQNSQEFLDPKAAKKKTSESQLILKTLRNAPNFLKVLNFILEKPKVLTKTHK